MNIQSTQIELIEMLLRTKKESVLSRVKLILQEEQFPLSEDDYAMIDDRRENHLEGKSKSYSWEETKDHILNR